MSAILVVGATGGTGRAIVAHALARGMRVRALSRSTGTLPAGVDEVLGDALDAGAVARAVAGVDAVICALGPRPGAPVDTASRATANLVDAMREHGVRRLIVVTGAMIGHPPARLSWLYRAILRAMPRSQRELVADRREQERHVLASDLDWTVVRPPRLTSGRPTGRVAAGPDRYVGALARIDRDDLAAFVVGCVDDLSTVQVATTVASV